MSDIQVPSIPTLITNLTIDVDTVNGGAQDDLINGELTGDGGTGVNTMNAADIINGGGGVDLLRLITSGNGHASVAGTTVLTTEVFQVQNFADSLDVNMINMHGLETLWLQNNTGDSEFTLVQDPLDIVLSGGASAGNDTFETTIDYDPSLFGGANDTQNILLAGGSTVDLEINDYNGANAIENLALQADGAPSYMEFEITGLENVMVHGNSSSLELWQENWNGSDEYLVSFDSTQFAGNLIAGLDVGNGFGTATVDTANGSDELYLYGNSSSALEINTRNGNDMLYVGNADSVDVLLGYGDDEAWIGWDDGGTNSIGYGGVSVNGAKGSDSIHVNTDGDLYARTGDNNDSLELYYVGGNADVKTGWGFDNVTNSGGVDGFLDIDLGLGDDTLNTYAGAGASVIAAAGNDNITITSGGDVTVKAGSGNNTMNVSISGSWYDDGTFFAGDDMDSLTFTGTGLLTATLRGGDDTVNVQGGVAEEMYLDLGAGNDQVNIGAQELLGTDTIMAGDGYDTLNTTSLDYIDNTGIGTDRAFGSTTSLERVQLNSNTATVFSGENTGANAAGVLTYDFLSNISPGVATNLMDMASGVTLNTVDSDGAWDLGQDLTLDLVGSSGTANLNVDIGYWNSYGLYSDVTLTNVGTFNVMGIDSSYYQPILYLGYDGVFSGDAELTTMTLSGSSDFNVDNVWATNLATIDAGSLTTNVALYLYDVANAVNAADASITVTTGTGNDYVGRVDSSANYDISTGDGADSVTGYGGNDNIKLGAGDDEVKFTNAADLDAFDTVNGGAGTDTLEILSGGIIGDDNSFFLIKEIENWILSDSSDDLVMGNIAQSSGIQRISLGNGSDTLTLNASYTSALEVTIGDDGSNDTVDAGLSAATLTVLAESNDLDGFDVITGGTGLMDELRITAVNGPSDLNGMTAVEKITVVPDYNGGLTITAYDNNVAAGATLTVVGSNMDTVFSPTGSLTFIGSAENDGNFVVTSGIGDDVIQGGAGADTFTTNNGNDFVAGNGGNDTIDTGAGNDYVEGGLGEDSITGGTGDDELYGDSTSFDPLGGKDVINAGAGADYIYGGAGADTIDAGLADGAIDTLYYEDVLESYGSVVDQVSNFASGFGGDKIDLSSLVGPQQFVGNGANFGLSQALLTDGDGIIDVVFDVEDQLFWVDVNDDGTLNADDLQVHLIGVTGITADNLVLNAP